MGKITFAACAAVISLLVAGCQTKPIEAMNYSERNELAKVLAKRCLDQGVRAGTKQMENCLIAEVQAEQYKRYENRRQMQAMGDAMQNAGNQMQANAAMNRPVNCTSTKGYGNVVRTTCY